MHRNYIYWPTPSVCQDRQQLACFIPPASPLLSSFSSKTRAAPTQWLLDRVYGYRNEGLPLDEGRPGKFMSMWQWTTKMSPCRGFLFLKVRILFCPGEKSRLFQCLIRLEVSHVPYSLTGKWCLWIYFYQGPGAKVANKCLLGPTNTTVMPPWTPKLIGQWIWMNLKFLLVSSVLWLFMQ